MILLSRVSNVCQASVVHKGVLCIPHRSKVSEATKPLDELSVVVSKSPKLLEIFGFLELWPGGKGFHFTVVHFTPFLLRLLLRNLPFTFP